MIGELFIFVFYLFIALQVAALIGGVVSRVWKLTPQQMVWRGTSVENASNNVRAFLIDIDDSRFAYPTGQFLPDPAKENLGAGRVVMREQNFKGSKGFGVAFSMIFAAGRWAGHMMGESLFIGFIGGIIALYFAVLLAVPFLIASVIDVVYRSLYRSEITAQVSPHPTIANAVTIDLTFQGLSAFGIVGDVLRAIAEPAAPVGTAAHTATLDPVTGAPVRLKAAEWASSAERRSSVIYGTGVAVSIAVALLITAVSGSLGGSSYDASSYADSSYSSDSSSSSDSGSSDSSSDTSSSDDSSSDGSDDTSTDDTSTDDSGTTFVSSQGGFSVTPPDGWVQDSDYKDKGGYYETRWHLSGSPEIHGYVDNTPSFTGSASSGASPLRANQQDNPDYTELDFSGDGDEWRWEFELAGDHKLDVFHRCPGGGYAVLAAAPVSDWDTYSTDLEGFVDSFSCDGSAEDPSASTGTSSDDSSDSSDSSSDYTYSADTLSGRMERAVRSHWQARLDGDYSKAYGYYTGAIANRAGSESKWASQIAADGLTDVTFNSFDSTETTPSKGRMDVSLDTESDDNGCQSWVFHYTLVHTGGRWRISDSTTDNSSC